jgi:uncharacterized cupin superfamily protein
MNQRIDVAAMPTVAGSRYPSPFDEPCGNKSRQGLGAIAGLTQFGVNLLRLQPGAWSSQRHWHNKEDEFVYVLTGEVVLVTDSGEEVLRAGDAAGFKAGDLNGHCLQNPMRKPRCSKSALARRTTPVITQTLTWWRLPDICRRSIPIVMARPTRTSDGARDAKQMGAVCFIPSSLEGPLRSTLLYDRSRLNRAGQSDHMRAVDVASECYTKGPSVCGFSILLRWATDVPSPA